MEEPKLGAFSFKEFSVPEFHYVGAKHRDVPLGVGLNPIGIYDQQSKEFVLEFNLICYSKDTKDSLPSKENIIVEIKSRSVFVFDSPCSFDQIPDYFFENSLPISFPYIRAFISSATMLANLKPINLNLFNFTSLAKQFKENSFEKE